MNHDEELQLIRSCLTQLSSDGKLPHDLSPARIEENTSIDALGIDSLGKAEVLLELEKRRDGVLLSERTDDIRTISDLCALLQNGEPQAVGHRAVGIDSREGSLSDYARVRSDDLFAKVSEFSRFLDDLRERGDEQYLLPVKRYRGARAVVDAGAGRLDKEVIAFCSANYLGMSFEPDVVESVKQAVDAFGASVASVPLIAGSTSLHAELQSRLARFVGVEDVVLFPTGHAANIGTIAALTGPRDLVVVDKQVHYSILEGVRLSGAPWVSFRHSEPDDLDRVLRSARERQPESGILVIIEGVYGIDGDVAPLPELMTVAKRYGARIMVDDAHATGVLGARGAGTREHYSLDEAPDLIMGSLSKSLGSMGGWIATDKRTADYLRYFSKTIVFSVGLPAVNIGAALTAVELIEREPQRLEELRRKASALRAGLMDLGLANPSKSSSSIISVLIGEERTLRDVVRDLFEEGVWVEGLPFPAVTRGQERIRFRVSTLHQMRDIEETVKVVAKVLSRHRIIGTGSDRGRNRPSAVVELARESASARGLRLPWLTADFYERIVSERGHWSTEEPGEWFVEGRGERAVAACQARVTTVQQNGVPTRAGIIGHLHWLPDDEPALDRVLDRAISSLVETEPELPIFAPIHTPLQILGGGIVCEGDPSRGPFLEPATSPDCHGLLESHGFEECGRHRYRRVSLQSARDALGPAPEKSHSPVNIRPIDRTRLMEEVGTLVEPFNRSIGRIDLCSPVSPPMLYGIARDLRELIVPELWLVAEVGGRVAGFVGAFPDVSEGFERAAGAADVADLDFMRTAVDAATRGFVAWLAVDPEDVDLGIGRKLLASVYAEMARRGYDETLLSWEMRDGFRTEEHFAPQPEHTLDHIDFQIYRR